MAETTPAQNQAHQSTDFAKQRRELEKIEDPGERSEKAAEIRKKEIKATIEDPKERKVIELYEKGVQNYEIARRVYEFVNQDTVGQVVLFIRKHYADDYSEVENVESTKGYSGIK